ncbi:Indoleamine 2,3-dioxygenase 1 [Trichinella spiralis]|uniref:Indoleamine 2,3-dioxygenase 1 n=1 Tax=Trichinella spiralis TaxID=6334 RepID=A0A0V1B2D4_TRISP|nr:Indoleamine 2,3-dioxygenase 1 [Trichinella spiralis]
MADATSDKPQMDNVQATVNTITLGPSLPSSFDDGDFNRWLLFFEVCVEANGWSDTIKAKKLPTFLKGDALIIFLCNEPLFRAGSFVIPTGLLAQSSLGDDGPVSIGRFFRETISSVWLPLALQPLLPGSRSPDNIVAFKRQVAAFDEFQRAAFMIGESMRSFANRLQLLLDHACVTEEKMTNTTVLLRRFIPALMEEMKRKIDNSAERLDQTAIHNQAHGAAVRRQEEPRRNGKLLLRCWSCGGVGHLARNCRSGRRLNWTGPGAADRRHIINSHHQVRRIIEPLNVMILLTTYGVVGGYRARILFHSDSAISLICKNLLSLTNCDKNISGCGVVLLTASGEEVNPWNSITLPLQLGSFDGRYYFVVMDSLLTDVILGADFMTKYGICIDLGGRLKNCLTKELLRRIILSKPDGSDLASQLKSINLKDCCYMPAQVWESISGNTLRKYKGKSNAQLIGMNIESAVCFKYAPVTSAERDEVEQWLDDDDNPLFEALTDDDILEAVEKDEDEDGDESDMSDKPNERLCHSEAYSSFKFGLKWMEQQKELSAAQLMVVRHIRDVAAQKKLSSLKQRLIADFIKSNTNTDRWLGTRIPTTDMILRKRPEKTIFLAAVTAVSFNDTSFQQILENRLPDQSNLQLTVAKENFQVRIKNSQSTEFSMEVYPLHSHLEYIDECIKLLNAEWPRSSHSRIHSLAKSNDHLPVSLVLVRTSDQRLLGHARLCRIPDRPEWCLLESVVIEKSERGRGLGRHLVKECERFAQKVGFLTIYLTTVDRESFYKHCGYTVCDPVITLLRDFHISAKLGFVLENPEEHLPSYYNSWNNTAANIRHLLAAGNVRSTLENLPLLDVSSLCSSHRQLRLAHLQLATLVSGYIWCESEIGVPKKVPRCLAVPYSQVSEKLGLQIGIAPHVTVALANYKQKCFCIFNNKPFIADDHQLLYFNFFDDDTNHWFFLATVEVEVEFSNALPAFFHLAKAIKGKDVSLLTEGLKNLATAIHRMHAKMRRLKERVDANEFYHKLRPFLSGTTGPAFQSVGGIILEGVANDQPMKLVGGSAAQSCAIQCLDTCLGVQHSADAGSFLKLMRQFMLPNQRCFLHWLETKVNVRSFLLSTCAVQLDSIQAYNDCIGAMTAFRRVHVALVNSYIVKPRQMEIISEPAQTLGDHGTAGTTVMPFLISLIQSTEQCKLNLPLSD